MTDFLHEDGSGVIDETDAQVREPRQVVELIREKAEAFLKMYEPSDR